MTADIEALLTAIRQVLPEMGVDRLGRETQVQEAFSR
jgi:hypothetical protein